MAIRLSPNEQAIMELIWSAGRPLSRQEILEGTDGRSWNPASIHLVLNNMLSKGILRITDQTVRYGRTYGATILGNVFTPWHGCAVGAAIPDGLIGDA